MAKPQESEAPVAKRRWKKPFLIGIVLALVLGGSGFYGVTGGMVLSNASKTGRATTSAAVAALPDLAFVSLDPLVISLGQGGQAHYLKFTAELEVNAGQKAEVTLLKPRVLDALNGYLRAVDMRELEDPRALFRLRAQMLRRIQVITGEGRVRDLLVTEFVLN